MSTPPFGHGRLVIRSRYYQVVGGTVVMAFAVAGVIAGVSDPEVGVVFALIWAAVCSVPLWRVLGVALVDDGETVTLRNVCSTVRIPWSDVERVEVTTTLGNGYSAAVALRVRGRRRRRIASGTVCYTRSTAQWICATLERHAADHGVPASLDAGDLRSHVLF